MILYSKAVLPGSVFTAPTARLRVTVFGQFQLIKARP